MPKVIRNTCTGGKSDGTMAGKAKQDPAGKMERAAAADGKVHAYSF